MEQIQQQISEYITKELVWSEEVTIDQETPLIQEGIIDSIGLFRLVAFLEQTFDLVIPDEDLRAENFQTIRQIVEYVEQHLVSKRV
jgi:acyl carrier protein